MCTIVASRLPSPFRISPHLCYLRLYAPMDRNICNSLRLHRPKVPLRSTDLRFSIPFTPLFRMHRPLMHVTRWMGPCSRATSRVTRGVRRSRRRCSRVPRRRRDLRRGSQGFAWSSDGVPHRKCRKEKNETVRPCSSVTFDRGWESPRSHETSSTSHCWHQVHAVTRSRQSSSELLRTSHARSRRAIGSVGG